jgi:AAA domain
VPGQPLFLNQRSEINNFLEFLYRDKDGYVYIATKHPENAEWKSDFFVWPTQRDSIIEHIIQESAAKEVYIAPALFETNSALKKHVKGTHVFWCEFDGTTPATHDMPPPTLRVQSSELGHEHWYWSLDYFEVDTDAIERANRGLTYTLGADTSGWDANQVLRPPTTRNFKRDRPVVILARSDASYGAELFSQIPVPDYNVKEIVLAEIPEALNVIAKYHWTEESFIFFRKTDIPVGSRSSAMMRLAFYCAEMKMSDEEAYSILDNADNRWKKFINRSDRVRRLQDLLFKARLKYPLEADEPVLYEEYPTYGFKSFMETSLSIKWIIEGLLQERGMMLFSGAPGVGKTSISLQWAIHMALGKEFLGYKLPETKIIFLSMEMGHADLKYFLSQMGESLTTDEWDTLERNLLLIPLGFGVFLDKPADQARVTRLVTEHGAGGIFFDSLGSTTMDELSNESTIKTIIDYVEHLRQDHDIFAWFIHHNRKAQTGNKKPNKLSDVYGSQYITARATTVLGLWQTGVDSIEVTGLKVRLSRTPEPFTLIRGKGLTFTREAPGASLARAKINRLVEREDEDASGEQFNLDF